MASNDRLEISRLVHRFGFGPKPGEFAALNSLGLKAARSALLSVPQQDVGLAKVSDPVLSDLGPFPPQKSAAAATFETNRSAQILSLQLWWLDRMASADNALIERMTWFWHGHWATALGKVEYALPMYIQNQLLRTSSLGNFRNQARSMIVDSALLYWLDGESNVAGSPNENLAREFMELFTLGVGAYSESDVQTLARALTGYNTVRSAGTVSFNPKKHDSGTLTFLGTTGSFDAPAASDFITTLSANQSFIPKRMWYRFISSTNTLLDTDTVSAFSNREILPLVSTIATHAAMSNPQNSQVKSPVEWFVGVCRALEILPSALPHNANVIRYLAAMGQVPFDPPNVGGWPTDEAWLNISSMQSRMAFSKYILSQVDLSKMNALPQSDMRIQYLADLFGVAEWSSRTKSVFRTSLDNPQELVLIAINAPDYVVNA
jgi:uncharacterized protein (DUF1800 family)